MNMNKLDLMNKKEKVAANYRELLAGTEDLLRSTASYTGEEIESARKRLKRQLEDARAQASDWEQDARERYRRASAATDEYVHENPWKTVGMAALAGVLVGVCLVGSNRR